MSNRRMAAAAAVPLLALGLVGCSTANARDGVGTAKAPTCPSGLDTSTYSRVLVANLPTPPKSERPGASTSPVPDTSAIQAAIACRYGPYTSAEAAAVDPKDRQATASERLDQQAARQAAADLNANSMISLPAGQTIQSIPPGWVAITVFAYTSGPDLWVVHSGNGVITNGTYKGYNTTAKLTPSPSG